jgi:excisionase family DNA binding protein
MSSNISIQKTCETCGQQFTAKTLITRFCSTRCQRRNYKAQIRETKQQIYNKQEINIINPTSVLANVSQEYFALSEAAVVMRVSKRTLYRLIAERKLKSKKIMSRTVILKSDMNLFFAIQ